jgi:hypothetical protein
MECKVCTKCKESKELFQFSKGKASCKRCIYDLYTRPSVLKRLQPRKTKEEKYATLRKNQKAFYKRKRESLPPPIPKERWAKKPPIIKLKMSDYMTPDELREHRNRVKREHRRAKPEQLAAQRRRDYNSAKNKPEFKTAKNIRKRLKKFLKPGTRLGSFSYMIGCTIEELIKHLESLFEPGMTWDNYGIDGWHIDHIKPLAAFDVTDKSTWTEINHHTNLRPMWANKNNGKSSYWMGVRWTKGKPVTD